ncbi:MAG: TolC family protein [Candidatus Schekmanbacteria bacterium]|nr:TolC family protein [Candidatus Schekmanbacteria bacterium]
MAGTAHPTILIIIFITLLPALAFAQKAYNLSQLEDLLREENLSVKAAYQRLQAVFNEKEEAGLFDVKFGMGSTLYPNGYDRETKVRSDDDYILRNTITLSYPILKNWLGRRYAILEKEAQAQEKAAELQTLKNDVLLSLRLKYQQAIFAGQTAEIYHQGDLQTAETIKQMRLLYAQRQILLTDLLFAEKKQLQMRRLAAKYDQIYNKNQSELAVLVNIPEKDFSLIRDQEFSRPPLPDLAVLQNSALQNQPLFTIWNSRRLAEKMRTEGTIWESFNFQFTAGYNFENVQNAKNNQWSYLGLNLSFPLGYLAVNSLREQQASSKQYAYEIELRAAQNQLKNQLQALVNQFQSIALEHELAEKEEAEAAARIRLYQMRRHYSPLNENDLRQFIQAQWDLCEAKAQLLRLREEQFLTYYQILNFIGCKDLPEKSPCRKEQKRKSRSLLVNENLLWDDNGEREFLIYFCQSKGINQVLLPVKSLAAVDLMENLAAQKIRSLIYLDLESVDALHKITQHAQLISGIYLVISESDLANTQNIVNQITQIRQTIGKQKLDFIIQIPLDIVDETNRLQIIASADEVAISCHNQPLEPDNKSFWQVIELSDFVDGGEQALQVEIKRLEDNNISVVLDNYLEYKFLLIH